MHLFGQQNIGLVVWGKIAHTFHRLTPACSHLPFAELLEAIIQLPEDSPSASAAERGQGADWPEASGDEPVQHRISGSGAGGGAVAGTAGTATGDGPLLATAGSTAGVAEGQQEQLSHAASGVGGSTQGPGQLLTAGSDASSLGPAAGSTADAVTLEALRELLTAALGPTATAELLGPAPGAVTAGVAGGGVAGVAAGGNSVLALARQLHTLVMRNRQLEVELNELEKEVRCTSRGGSRGRGAGNSGISSGSSGRVARVCSKQSSRLESEVCRFPAPPVT